MSFSTWFSWATSSSSQELPELFPLGVEQKEFVDIDMKNIYAKIITDVLERTEGIPDQYTPSLWDNCLKSENSEGLVTMLSKAMVNKSDLFLVYDKAVKLLRKATNTEEVMIKKDYSEQGSSNVGVFVSFKNYRKSDMVRLYSVLEYCAITSLNKNMNLSKAIQFKMNDLRGSVALNDKSEIQAQVQSIVTSLSNGKDIYTDAKDIIETATPDLTATEKAMTFINERRSFYLGMPASYVTGEAPAGLGDSGEGDAKAVERGLKNYYFSIVKPVVEAVFDTKTSFKSEDFRMISTSLQALQTFELVSDELMSPENKLMVINKLFGFPKDTKGGQADEPPPPPEPPQPPAE